MKKFVGAHLTETYAYMGAALTNPSIVAFGDSVHGSQSFVMSARAIGEGHVSSIAFITGAVAADGTVTLDWRSDHVSNGTRSAPRFSRRAFADKLDELDFLSSAARWILSALPDHFAVADLHDALDQIVDADLDALEVEEAVKRVHWLADSNYELRFDPAQPISEHLISPAAPAESRGMEDARFVALHDDESTTFYATYTAFDGIRILPQLIETRDFHTFRIATMTGPAVHHKGMALFPRKIAGEYVALSRHDNEKSYVLRSDDVRRWSNAELVFGPERDWEVIQTGNCGSPIETEAGWLVITHGVGAMRRYSLGAVLLDVDDPAKLIGRLNRPLLEPEADELYGYVPNVVYSCGSIVHDDYLVTPYGYADEGISFAVTSLSGVIDEMC